MSRGQAPDFNDRVRWAIANAFEAGRASVRRLPLQDYEDQAREDHYEQRAEFEIGEAKKLYRAATAVQPPRATPAPREEAATPPATQEDE